MSKRVILFILCAFILADLVYSFKQHQLSKLDGDMAGIILPSNHYQQVMDDPMGWSVLKENKEYAGTNRYFAHWTMSKFFRSVPLILQKAQSPVDSVYNSVALAKLLIQLLILLAMTWYVTQFFKSKWTYAIFAMAILTTLIQSFGYNGTMGIIDPSVTYSFFYGLSTFFILIFFAPFLRSHLNRSCWKPNNWVIVIWGALALFCALNGPLSPALLILVSGSIIFGRLLFKDYKGPKKSQTINSLFSRQELVILFIAMLLGLYSLFIGLYNIESAAEPISLLERYTRIPESLLNIITRRLGIPILVIAIITNTWILKKKLRITNWKIISFLLKAAGIFMLIYLILLPFGGYRDYRPDIIRRDTMIPITILIMMIYTLTSMLIIKHASGNFKKFYAMAIVAIGIIFMAADGFPADRNNCERNAIELIAASKTSPLKIESDCRVMAWSKITDPAASKNNSDLFQLWRITEQEMLYYQD